MDSHALDYYSSYSDENPSGHFHRVISLHDNQDLDWSAVKELAPTFPKGWFELARLLERDRIDFTRDFWLSKMPYRPLSTEALNKFFGSIDDIGVFLVQNQDEHFEAQMVYSLAQNSGFFHGNIPATDNEIIALQKDFPDYILPVDYLAFLQIHNGFAKLTDTGIIKSSEMKAQYLGFQEILDKEDAIVLPDGNRANPRSLIPFYKSFGMSFFQCFWGEWYPENEMGNVYYSGVTKTISDCTKSDYRIETMAFETFTDWLMFYLEKID